MLNDSELGVLSAASSKNHALLKVAIKDTKEQVGIVAGNLYLGIELFTDVAFYIPDDTLNEEALRQNIGSHNSPATPGYRVVKFING